MLKFSVVIPVFNSSATILGSLSSCLNQTHIPHEVIIVDDCSADDTVTLMEGFLFNECISENISVKIIKLPENAGPSNARNHGWNISTGDYVAFLDADDVWHPRKLEIMDSVLTGRPDIDLLGHECSLSLFSSNPALPFSLKKIDFHHLLLKNFSATPCIVVRRSVEERFSTDMRYAEDHELWLRISSRHSVYKCPLILTQLGRCPLSSGGLSANKFKMRLGEMKMYLIAARYNKAVLFLLPFLIIFAAFKHLNRIVRLTISRRNSCQHSA